MRFSSTGGHGARYASRAIIHSTNAIVTIGAHTSETVASMARDTKLLGPVIARARGWWRSICAHVVDKNNG
jgi:hypothetical protein